MTKKKPAKKRTEKGAKKNRAHLQIVRETGVTEISEPFLKEDEEEHTTPADAFALDGVEGAPAAAELPEGEEQEPIELGEDSGAKYREEVDTALDAVDKMRQEGKLTAEEAADLDRKIVALYDKAKRTKRKLRDVTKDTKDKNGAWEGKLAECVEIGIDRTKRTAAAEGLRKLRKIEYAYQGMKEAKSEGIERRKAARDAVKAAEKNLDDLMENWRQLGITYDDGSRR